MFAVTRRRAIGLPAFFVSALVHVIIVSGLQGAASPHRTLGQNDRLLTPATLTFQLLSASAPVEVNVAPRSTPPVASKPHSIVRSRRAEPTVPQSPEGWVPPVVHSPPEPSPSSYRPMLFGERRPTAHIPSSMPPGQSWLSEGRRAGLAHSAWAIAQMLALSWKGADGKGVDGYCLIRLAVMDTSARLAFECSAPEGDEIISGAAPDTLHALASWLQANQISQIRIDIVDGNTNVVLGDAPS